MSAYVLIVDDDPEVLDVLRDVLEGAGYRTVGTTTFEEGRRLLAASPPPAVLVTDVRLGAYNGLQLAHLRDPATRLVVISGFLDRTLEAEATRLGGVYLLKPVPGTQLLDAVRAQLAGA